VHKLIEVSLGQGDQNVLYAAVKNNLVSVVELSGGRDYDYVGPWDQRPSLNTGSDSVTYSAQWGVRFVTKKVLEKLIKILENPKLFEKFKPYLSDKNYKILDRYRWKLADALEPLLKYDNVLKGTIVNTVRDTLIDLGVKPSTARTISYAFDFVIEVLL